MSSVSPSTNTKNERISSEELERIHFQHVINAFVAYKKHSLQQVGQKMKCLMSLPQHHQDMVPTQFDRIKEWHEAISANNAFLCKVVECTSGMFINSDVSGGMDDKPVTVDDIDRVRTTLKQCIRDWSAEGKEERRKTYELITDELVSLFKSFDRQDVHILVPGAGLGRLMYEIAKLGFTCQGNEYSLYMLFASNYILNMCNGALSETIHPWIHQTCNIMGNMDQLRAIRIPDIDPQNLKGNVNFSMAAGDFMEIYVDANSWNAVVMCFFLDTAHNVINYIEKAYTILKPGGYLINLGPLLYHYADIEKELSIELTYDEMRFILLEKFKFKLITERLCVKSSYTRNIRSMFTMVYDCVYFVVQKPL